MKIYGLFIYELQLYDLETTRLHIIMFGANDVKTEKSLVDTSLHLQGRLHCFQSGSPSITNRFLYISNTTR